MMDACEKCLNLNGQTFHDQDLFQGTLWSPVWGDLMNLDTGLLLTHLNCRCQCEVIANVNLREIDELTEFQNFLGLMY